MGATMTLAEGVVEDVVDQAGGMPSGKRRPG